MDEFHLIIKRLGDWLEVAPHVPLTFAEPALSRSLRTPPQALLELVLVVRGRLPLTVGDRGALLGRNQLALVNAHFGNFGVLDDDVIYACVSFDIGDLPEFTDLAQSPLLLLSDLPRGRGMEQVFQRLCAAFHAPPTTANRWQLKASALALLAQLSDHAAVIPDSISRPRAGGQVRAALVDLSRGQGRSDLAIADIADRQGISHGHLCRLFHQQLGCSPSAYLLELRMRRAAGMLRRTSMAVKEVSHQVGFRDPLYFSRAFKAYAGKSPRAFRHG